MEKESFDFLTETGVKIIQSTDGYKFTSDALALANFVECKPSDTVFDVGCGSGVISLVVADRCKPKKIVAVDIQKDAYELAKRNVELNNFQEFIEVYCADVRNFHSTIGANLADIIVCNPPYFSNGQKSEKANVRAARHDETLTLEELAESATRLLKYGGLLYICFPAKYTARAAAVLEGNNFRVRKMTFLKNEKEIYLVMIKAKKGGGHGTAVNIFN